MKLFTEIIREGPTATACKFRSDKHGLSEAPADLGCEVVYIGAPISGAIRGSFLPMV